MYHYIRAVASAPRYTYRTYNYIKCVSDLTYLPKSLKRALTHIAHVGRLH